MYMLLDLIFIFLLLQNKKIFSSRFHGYFPICIRIFEHCNGNIFVAY